jgi:hypothetical protein
MHDRILSELEHLVEGAESLTEEERGRIASALESAARRIRRTYSRKEYVIACLVCDTLLLTQRADQYTCSAKCRAAFHRSGVKKIIARAGLDDVKPGMAAQVSAIQILGDDLARLVQKGESIASVMPKALRRFRELTDAA